MDESEVSAGGGESSSTASGGGGATLFWVTRELRKLDLMAARGLGGTTTLLWVTVLFEGVRERPAGRIMPEKPPVGVGLSRVRTERDDGARGPWLPEGMAVAPDEVPASWLDES